MAGTASTIDRLLLLAACLLFSSVCPVLSASPDIGLANDRYEAAAAREWREVFHDPCTGDWRRFWFLDGEVGVVKTGPNGIDLTAGPEFKNDAHHMVLWTKREFSGDLKISYEYTRLDRETRCVNILFIQATGSGNGPYSRDIAEWSALRRAPAMRVYYDHMHTYHLSYAAYPNNSDETSYIRGRRYLPESDGLNGTALRPDYFPSGLFETGIPHQISVIKADRELLMRVENEEQTAVFRMVNDSLPPISEGRVGLRHMFTRSARYRDFRISAPIAAGSEGLAEPHEEQPGQSGS